MSVPGDLWASFDHDPRQPDNAALRAADQDRDLISAVLAAAYADGRLDREEFDERSDRVASARTLGDLPPLVSDLVADRALEVRSSTSLVDASPNELRRRAEEHWEGERRSALTSFVVVSLFCWAIWVATGWGEDGFDPYFPWPLIVMAGSLATVIKAMVTKEDSIRDGVRHLEKKQAKQRRSKRLDVEGPEE